MQYYTWYPVSQATAIPVYGPPLDSPAPLFKHVEEAWSTLLLYDPAVGIQSGFYEPNEGVLYRHNEEYDRLDRCYDWVYEPCRAATYFMVITLPPGE